MMEEEEWWFNHNHPPMSADETRKWIQGMIRGGDARENREGVTPERVIGYEFIHKLHRGGR